MASLRLFLSTALATPALTQTLYATSYNDHALTTLQLDGSSLKTVSKSYDCGSEPTWLTLDSANSVLYCLNEGWGGNSTITSYQTGAAGALTTLDILPTLKSPVASTLYGPKNANLAVAYYDTSSFGTVSVNNPKDLAQTLLETYTLAAPGPVPDRQDAPHLHDAILDPTRKFIIVPDLGSDLLRIYRIGATNVTQLPPVKALPGSGPRHGAFAVVGRKTFFYNVNELSNNITGYSVSYTRNTLEFTRLFDFSTHGPGGSVPAGTKAAEIVVSVSTFHPVLIREQQN